MSEEKRAFNQQALAICPEDMRMAYHALLMAKNKIIDLSTVPSVDEAEIRMIVMDLRALTNQAVKSVREIGRKMGVRG